MKVRIVNNSIRFRLKQPEVEAFRKNGTISEVMEFGMDEGDLLHFTLERANGRELAVRFLPNSTTIYVPAMLADEWTGTDRVGFDGDADTGKGKRISVLVEKDFMCMDGRAEENEGSYPNPLKTNI